jgi:hypothetical protein
MEHGACNVIYIDRRAADEHVRRETLSSSLAARTTTGSVSQGYFGLPKASPAEIHANVESLLSIFSEGERRAPSRVTPPSANITASSHLRIRQFMSRQDLAHPRSHPRQHTHHCPHRHTLRRRAAPQATVA